jgi:hypothetical protein
MHPSISRTVEKALRSELMPDDILVNLPQLPADLRLEHKREVIDDIVLDNFLIQGSPETLLALAALLIAQAQSKSDDCGYQIMQTDFGKPNLFECGQSWEVYIHRLPCLNHSSQDVGL